MNWRSLQLALAALFLMWLGAISAASAQSAVVRCPLTPVNIPLFERSIERDVRDQIGAEYSRPRVRARLRRLAITNRRRNVELDSILTGLTLSVSGLTASASGSMSFVDSCEYQYILRIRVVAVEISSGVRLNSVNDSALTITTSGESELMRIRNSSSDSS